MTDVRLTATNPVDSSVVPVACNEKGELLLEEPLISSDEFVAKAGDTMTGNLHLGDKITLDATDGSATFAGGDVNIDSSGRLLVGTSTARSNYYYSTVARTPGVQYEDTGSDTSLSVYRSDGLAALYLANGSGSITDGTAIGGINFAGNDGTNLRSFAKIEAECDGTIGTADVPGRLVFATTSSGSPTAVGRMHLDSSGNLKIGTNPSSPSISLNADGSATFTSDVVVGSRNKQWMLVESGGICHLVEQTFRDADVDTADLVEDPATAADEPSSYPELRNLPKELDQLSAVVTALLTEVQRVEETLRMAPQAGWPVWDGSD